MSTASAPRPAELADQRQARDRAASGAAGLAGRRSRIVGSAAFERLLSVLSPVLLLALWEAAADLHWIDTRFFPAPSSIFATAGTMIQSGELWSNLSVSLVRIAIGFTIGAVPAVIL